MCAVVLSKHNSLRVSESEKLLLVVPFPVLCIGLSLLAFSATHCDARKSGLPMSLTPLWPMARYLCDC